MDWFKLFYTLLGGLGIFFFGMITLSQSLQAIAGGFIRRIINALTSNRFMAVGVGTAVTTLVQSSSITTVMVVGLVSAGLMELYQAIGVIMGANIGTTITGWIIAIKIGKYGLLLIGLGVFPMLFSKHDSIKNAGKILMALGFIFLGLEFMGAAFKPLRTHQPFIFLMHTFDAETYLSLWATIFVGALLTAIIQSSSAMLGITIALAATGSITFQTAAALVLGENIGTTITAILAGVTAGTEGKRAARAHAIFNILGVCVISPFFWSYIGLIDSMIPGEPDFVDKTGAKPFIAAHIAASHTGFNIANTIIFLPFVRYLAKFVIFITPAPRKKEIPHLRFIPSITDAAPSLALPAAEKEVVHLSEIIKKHLKLTHEYVCSIKPDKKIRSKIARYEDISDAIQGETTLFLCKLQEAAMTYEQSAQIYSLIRAADELESIGDYCEHLARYKDNLMDCEEKISKEAMAEIDSYFTDVIGYSDTVHKKLSGEGVWDLQKLDRQSELLKKAGDQIRENHQLRMTKGICKPKAGMFFSDIISSLRKIKSHSLNVAEAMAGKTVPTEELPS